MKTRRFRAELEAGDASYVDHTTPPACLIQTSHLKIFQYEEHVGVSG